MIFTSIHFTPMTEILNPRQGERFSLERFTVPKWHERLYGVLAGDYMRLKDNDEGFNNVVMSDTPMERRTNAEFINKAHGDVLIAGLGIGMIIIPLLKKDNIRSITVVEKFSEVIELVADQLPQDERLNIIQGDIFNNTFPRGTKFDTIYFDIWNYINNVVYETEMLPLKKLYKRCLRDKSSYMACWAEYEAKHNLRLY